MPDKIKFSSLNAYKEFENAHNDVIKNLGELLIHDISRFKKLLLKQSEKSLDKWLSIKLLTELKETSRLAHQSCRDGFQTSPPSAAVIETLYLTSEYNQKVAKLLNEANKLLNEAKYIEDKKEYGELFPPLPVEEDDKRFLDAYKKIPNKDRPEILDTLLKEEGEYSIQEEKGRMVDLVDWIDSQAWWRNNETPNYAELFHLVTDPTLEIKMPPEKIDKDFLKVYHNIPEKYRENVKDAIKKLKDSNEKATLKQKITAYFSDGKNETLCSEKYCQHFGVTEWLLKQETSLENVNKTLKQDKYIYIALLNGKGLTLFYPKGVKNTLVATIKNDLQQKENVPVNQQKLIFNGKHLEDDEKLLSEYGVTEKPKIYLIPKTSPSLFTCLQEVTENHKKATIGVGVFLGMLAFAGAGYAIGNTLSCGGVDGAAIGTGAFAALVLIVGMGYGINRCCKKDDSQVKKYPLNSMTS